MLEECPAEDVSLAEDDSYKAELEELDRRADRLMDAFAESSDLTSAYLQRALSRLEQERQALLEAQKRRKSRPTLPDRLVFSALGFEEKKVVAAQFIRRIEVHEDHAEIFWNI